MSMLDGDNTISLKLNMGHLFGLFTMTLNYDCQIMSDYLMRVNSPLTYVIPFEEYIKFIHLETTDRTDRASFLSSDKVLKEMTAKILPLVKNLEAVKKKIERGEKVENSFDAIPPYTLEAINKVYTNFLLNCAIVQAKIVEFTRWDTYNGEVVPRIMPDLGIFEMLRSMADVKLISEDNEYRGLTYERYRGVSSNLEVGKLDRKTLGNLTECVYPDFQLDTYLYRGIYGWTLPRGHYITETARIDLQEKIKRVQVLETAVQREDVKLRAIVAQYTVTHEEYLVGLRTRSMSPGFVAKEHEKRIISEVRSMEQMDLRGIPVTSSMEAKLEDLVRPFTVSHDEYVQKLEELMQDSTYEPSEGESRIYNLLEEIRKIQETEQLTSEETRLRGVLDDLKETVRHDTRYPLYAYEELIQKIDAKAGRGEELEPLEDDVLDTEEWVMTLLSLVQLLEEQRDYTDETYILGPTFTMEETQYDSPTVKATKYYQLRLD